MSAITIIQMSQDELGSFILQKLQEHENNKQTQNAVSGTCSINQAAKIIGCSHEGAKKLIMLGHLKTTADNRKVLKKSINDYLSTK